MAKDSAAAIPPNYFADAKANGLKVIYLIEGHPEPVFEKLLADMKRAQGANVTEVPVK